MAAGKTRLGFFVEGKPRQIMSFKAQGDGSVTIAINGGDTVTSAHGQNRKIKNRYVSVHASRDTKAGNLIKQTTRFEDGTKSEKPQFTDALPTDRVCLLFVYSPNDMRFDDYEIERVRPKDSYFSLGPFDPKTQTPVIFALMSRHGRVVSLSQKRRGVWFNMPDFRIHIIWAFHPIQSDMAGVFLCPITYRSGDGTTPMASATYDDDADIEGAIQWNLFGIANDRIQNARRLLDQETADHYAKALRINQIQI